MCRQETALDVIKSQPDSGGLSTAHIKLVESQIADFKTMDKRMAQVEQKVEGLSKKFDTLDSKINVINDKLEDIAELVQRTANPWESFKELISVKPVLFALIVIFCFALGVPLKEAVQAWISIG